jgi:hypothetical protein
LHAPFNALKSRALKVKMLLFYRPVSLEDRRVDFYNCVEHRFLPSSLGVYPESDAVDRGFTNAGEWWSEASAIANGVAHII